MKTITPKTLKGFRDFLPSAMRVRQTVMKTVREVFELYGYEPLETPTLEYGEILSGKYGSEAEQLMYQFTDRGGRSVAMRYDLTVPACRVLAQYQNDLPLPFKRYQMQPVWRAENTQKGRFREFYQCDADTFGTSAMLADGEFLAMGIELFERLGFKAFEVRINNRKLIDGMLSFAGVPETAFYGACIAIDKLEKIGLEAVQAELTKLGLNKKTIALLSELISLKGSSEELVSLLKQRLDGVARALEGLSELTQILDYLQAFGAASKTFRFDPTIIRGLSYYTGPIWEYNILDAGVGSVGGGGRYDNLVGLYLGKDIPATGGSFGIERLFEVMKERAAAADQSSLPVLVTIFSPELARESLQLAQKLRAGGKQVILYPDPTAKLEKQLKYANRKGIQSVYILGPEELKTGTPKLKNMLTGDQK